MTRLPNILRWMAQRSLRLLLCNAPQQLRNLAERIPFSRYSWMLTTMFWGHEQITWRGVHIIINPGTVLGFYPYFLGDYAGAEINALIEWCASAHILADVGANNGLISLAVAHACPNLHIYAFEPDPIIAARFRFNLQLNPSLALRITLVEKAVAEEGGFLYFRSEANGLNPETGHLVNNQTEAQSIEAVRLDSFFASLDCYPDVIKIDIEGAELRALEGMKGLFEVHPPNYLIVEVHAFYLPEADRGGFNQRVENRLLQAGYILSRIDDIPLTASLEWPSRIHVKATRRRSS